MVSQLLEFCRHCSFLLFMNKNTYDYLYLYAWIYSPIYNEQYIKIFPNLFNKTQYKQNTKKIFNSTLTIAQESLKKMSIRLKKFWRGAIRIFSLDGQIQGEVAVSTTIPCDLMAFIWMMTLPIRYPSPKTLQLGTT